MIAFKAGVRVTAFRGGVLMAPPVVIWRAMFEVVDPIWVQEGTEDGYTIITAVTDGVHSRFSDHYRCHAFDVRTSSLPGGYQGDAARRCASRLKQELGNDFQVILETDHVHVGFKPARIAEPVWT